MDEETEVRAAAQPLVIAAAIHDATAYRGKADLEVAEQMAPQERELLSPFAVPPGPGYQRQVSPIEPLQASSQSATEAAVGPPASLVEEVIARESDRLDALWAEAVWFYELEEMSARGQSTTKSDSAEDAVDKVFLLYWT